MKEHLCEGDVPASPSDGEDGSGLYPAAAFELNVEGRARFGGTGDVADGSYGEVRICGCIVERDEESSVSIDLEILEGALMLIMMEDDSESFSGIIPRQCAGYTAGAELGERSDFRVDNTGGR